jgi:hypothetical protein
MTRNLHVLASTSAAVSALWMAAPAIGMDGHVSGIVRANSCTEQKCLVVRVPSEDRIRADHGSSAGDPYDANGNLVDRHGYIVAVPESRSKSGGVEQAREIFVTFSESDSPATRP